MGYGVWDADYASGYIDPVARIGAQDEAVYGHNAIQMQRGRGWLTPLFLGRPILNKPPLLLWSGAASIGLFGVSPMALRLPVLAAGIATALMVFLWLRASCPLAAALAGVLLLTGNPVFHSMSRRFMMDVPLAAWIALAVFMVRGDPALARRSTAVVAGAAVGAAVLTKSIGGLLPALVLVVYWIIAERPRPARAALAAAAAAAVAAPWHIYQLSVHPQWFWAEYVEAQILQTGTSVTPMFAGDPIWLFYAKRLFQTDPVLSVLSLTGVIPVARHWRQEKLLLVWLAVTLAALLGFRYRVAHYMTPLVPVLCLASAVRSPLLRGWTAVAALGVLIGVKAAAPPASWSLDYHRGATIKPAAALKRYAAQKRGRELVIVNPDDEFYSALLDLPRVRYVYMAADVDPTKMPGHAPQLGLVLTGEQFAELPKWRAHFTPLLREWGAGNPDIVGTTIVVRSAAELALVIRASPERDFFLREQDVPAGLATHAPTDAGAGRVLLAARNAPGDQ